MRGSRQHLTLKDKLGSSCEAAFIGRHGPVTVSASQQQASDTLGHVPVGGGLRVPMPQDIWVHDMSIHTKNITKASAGWAVEY